MKKAIVSFLLLAVLLSAIIIVLPFGTPELPSTAGKLAIDTTGKVYTAKARPDGNWVYALGGNTVDATWRLPATVDGFPAPVQQLCGNGKDLAVLQSWHSTTETHWRIWRKTASGTRFSPVLDGTLEAGTSFPVLSFDHETLWLTFLQTGGAAARLCKVSETGAEATLAEVSSLAAPAGRFFTTATTLDGVLYALVDNGVLFANGTALDYKDEGTLLCSLKANAGTLIAWSAKGQNILYTGGLTLAALPALAGTETVLDGAAADEETAVFLSSSGEAPALLRLDTAGYARTNKLQSTLPVRVQVRVPLLLLVLGGLLLLYLVGLALYWLLKHCPFFALRITGLCFWIFALIVPLLATLSTTMLADELYSVILQNAATNAESILAETTESGLALAASGEHVSFLLYDGTQGYALAPAPGMPAGATAQAMFGPEVYQMATQAESQNAAVSKMLYNGLQADLCYLRPVTLPNQGPALMLLRVPGSVQETQLRSFFSQALLVLGGAALLMLLLIAATTWFMCRPLRALRSAMDKVATGAHIAPQKHTNIDEVGAIWRSLQEMSSSLNLQQYEYETAIRSYRRFVPDHLEEFLGYETPVSTRTGDMALVKGAVALVSAENRTLVRRQLNDEHFMGFVNTCYSAVEQSAQQSGGVLLGNAFNLSHFTVYFEQGNNSALHFSLALIDSQTASANENHPAPSYFQLLHNATFLNGVTGSKTRIINFISSQELDFLTEVAKRFEKINCHLVVTEQFMNDWDPQINTRYIGFVSSEDGRYTYKLHEVLDVYSSMERSRRQQYAVKFHAAIHQFYRAEFHTARNTFSSILKICPTDGVARWYLYACEHYFNRQDSENFSFGLLSTPLDLED